MNSELNTDSRLFVYGTLAPGRANQHVLANLAGEWHPARVKGKLVEKGWGAAQGYPGIILDERAGSVSGFLFQSASLIDHWQVLDDFEGAGYQRVKNNVWLEDGSVLQAFVYELSES
ncbi:gamma-glutamylcyclotransferase [Aliikangiella marina]|uniref:Gamma-glutamylcyclotransferase n=1 Tax=Aliikangiella marina TaxID=1712262 RepID=A0A545TD41_9GAMM|nr:gamma-glutamylcyclotransferase family protein [Aliikangiella marina]TQV75143.1 gamma-glutamylcyclotransferase [Aliikangiella marina]